LSSQQKALIIAFSETETGVDGSVDGVKQAKTGTYRNLKEDMQHLGGECQIDLGFPYSVPDVLVTRTLKAYILLSLIGLFISLAHRAT